MSNIIPFIPGVPPNIIPEEDVTIARLSGVLEAAFFEHQIDEDGQIYVSDGTEFPLWIELLSNRELLSLFTHWSLEDQREANWLVRVNQMNTSIMIPQFSCCRNSIWGGYWMTYAGGLNVRQFFKMLRSFSSAFVAGISASREELAKACEPELMLVKP
jgi:Putative bacterial sensory transduction regulator